MPEILTAIRSTLDSAGIGYKDHNLATRVNVMAEELQKVRVHNKYLTKRIEDMNKRQMCMDFMLMMPKNVAYTSMAARQAMNDRWGLDIDHHEFAYAIEILVDQGKMERVPGGYSYPRFRVKE